MDNKNGIQEQLFLITARLESETNQLGPDHWIPRLVSYLARTKDFFNDSNLEIEGFLSNVIAFVNFDIFLRIFSSRFEPAVYSKQLVGFVDFLENYLADSSAKKSHEIVVRKLKLFTIEFCFCNDLNVDDDVANVLTEADEKLYDLESRLKNENVDAEKLSVELDYAVRLLLNVRVNRNYNREKYEPKMNGYLARFVAAFRTVFDKYDFESLENFDRNNSDRAKLVDSFKYDKDDSSRDNDALLFEHFVHPFTRHWIMKNVRAWLECPEKSVYFISSNKGFGKTCLAVQLFKRYESNTLGFYSIGAKSRVDCANMMKEIFVEILMNNEELRTGFLSSDHPSVSNLETGEKVVHFIAHNKYLNSADTTNIRFTKNLVLIDNVDKLSSEDRDSLTKFIKLIGDLFAKRVLFLVTFDNNILNADNNKIENIDKMGINLNAKENINYHLNDVDFFISKLFTSVVSKKLTETGKELVSHFNVDDRNVYEILEEILKTSAGSFSYVKTFFACLERAMDECASNMKSAFRMANKEFGQIVGTEWEDRKLKFNQSVNAYKYADGNYRVNFDIGTNANNLYSHK